MRAHALFEDKSDHFEVPNVMRSSFLFKNACRFGGFVNNFSNSAFSSFIFCLSFRNIQKAATRDIVGRRSLPVKKGKFPFSSFQSAEHQRRSQISSARFPRATHSVYHACASRARRDENVRRRERKRQKRTSLDPPPPNNQKEGGKVPFYTHLCLWRDG